MYNDFKWHVIDEDLAAVSLALRKRRLALIFCSRRRSHNRNRRCAARSAHGQLRLGKAKSPVLEKKGREKISAGRRRQFLFGRVLIYRKSLHFIPEYAILSIEKGKAIEATLPSIMFLLSPP